MKEDGYGMILFVYAVILTRGIQHIKEDMDNSQNSLIGMHGYCTQVVMSTCSQFRSWSIYY